MTKKSRFVKYDDSYFEVKINEATSELKGGISLVPIDEEKYVSAVADRTVLEDVSIEIGEENLFQELIDSARDELMVKFKSNIKDTVLGILGFEKDRWGNNDGFRVDHCNGRMSSVTKLIAKDLEKQILDVTYQEVGLTDGDIKELKEAMREDFLRTYKDQLSRSIYYKAQDLANQHISELIESLVKSKTKDVAEVALDTLLKTRRKKNDED